jgi:hypothetical protein
MGPTDVSLRRAGAAPASVPRERRAGPLPPRLAWFFVAVRQRITRESRTDVTRSMTPIPRDARRATALSTRPRRPTSAVAVHPHEYDLFCRLSSPSVPELYVPARERGTTAGNERRTDHDRRQYRVISEPNIGDTRTETASSTPKSGETSDYQSNVRSCRHEVKLYKKTYKIVLTRDVTADGRRGSPTRPHAGRYSLTSVRRSRSPLLPTRRRRRSHCSNAGSSPAVSRRGATGR